MTRRASLPGADELFRKTDPSQETDQASDQEESSSRQVAKSTKMRVASAEERVPRHDEKVTFYCTAPELNRLEGARLSLRADFRMPSDRGRIVRAALAEILDDFELRGPNSALVKRLEQI